MKRFLIFAMSFAVAVTAFAQTAPPREPAPVDTVSVTGTARVTTTPDRFSFNVAESVFNQRDAIRVIECLEAVAEDVVEEAAVAGAAVPGLRRFVPGGESFLLLLRPSFVQQTQTVEEMGLRSTRVRRASWSAHDWANGTSLVAKTPWLAVRSSVPSRLRVAWRDWTWWSLIRSGRPAVAPTPATWP